MEKVFNSATSDSAFANVAAGMAISGFIQHQVTDGLAGVDFVNKNFYQSIASYLRAVQYAQQESDSVGARAALDQAAIRLKSLKSRDDVKRIGFLLSAGGSNKQIADLWVAFSKYTADLEHSVNEAQSVPAQIDAFVKSNQSGLRMFEAASRYQGAQYQKGMTCSDLINKAALDAGIHIAFPPCHRLAQHLPDFGSSTEWARSFCRFGAAQTERPWAT